MRFLVLLVAAVGWASAASAQDAEFDGEAFVKAVNQEIEKRDLFGVEMTGSPGALASMSLSSSVKQAVDAIQSIADYIAEGLCAKKSRPTRVMFSLNARYELVWGASAGSEIEWNLEEVCGRYTP